MVTLIGKINWTQESPIHDDDKESIQKLLTDNYYIILTRHRNHLSTYAISIADFFVTGKFSFWSHALMNLENDVTTIKDFRLMQAIGTGVEYATFDDVFGDADAVVLLQPKGFTPEEWTAVMEKSKIYEGRPYDTLYDITNDNTVSCVELVRDALKADVDYDTKFADFERLINKANNLTPQMLYDSVDFEIVYQVRR